MVAPKIFLVVYLTFPDPSSGGSITVRGDFIDGWGSKEQPSREVCLERAKHIYRTGPDYLVARCEDENGRVIK